ncbi:MAG: YHYH protein [Bacteroidetes bacterium]|nr:YHYH protein [Bacteroidota bacterium]
MRKTTTIAVAILFSFFAKAQLTPEITSWILNTNSATGYNNIPSDVQIVQYSATQVYISCTCIPGYSIGPWTGNPNTPSNQNFVYMITRAPVQNTGSPVVTPLGHIGVWSNGVSVFNAKDGMSYNNQGIWNRNALYYEGISFDSCLGHPAPNGEYHNHVNPHCLYDDHDSSVHSPIIGYAFDGFPIYGAFAYTNTNGTGPVTRMRSSYVLSSNTTRTNGPNVNSTYPAGCFCEDYVYTPGAGDLDIHNGRFCVTPDYPSGIYAYFVTLNDTLYPQYPYVLGPTYYGTVQAGNTGPGGGHVTITETTTVYTGAAGVYNITPTIKYTLMPNPTSDFSYIYFDPSSTTNNIAGELFDANGQLIETFENMQPGVQYRVDLSQHAAGIYILLLQSNGAQVKLKLVRM